MPLLVETCTWQAHAPGIQSFPAVLRALQLITCLKALQASCAVLPDFRRPFQGDAMTCLVGCAGGWDADLKVPDSVVWQIKTAYYQASSPFQQGCVTARPLHPASIALVLCLRHVH